MGPRIQEWDPCAGTGGIWQSEHDFRDKHASQFTTGRFVLLPKNLVTGAAKARIVIVRPRRVGPHRQLKPRLSRGFFLADAHDASHFEAGALGRSWALPPWRSGRGFFQRYRYGALCLARYSRITERFRLCLGFRFLQETKQLRQ